VHIEKAIKLIVLSDNQKTNSYIESIKTKYSSQSIVGYDQERVVSRDAGWAIIMHQFCIDVDDDLHVVLVSHEAISSRLVKFMNTVTLVGSGIRDDFEYIKKMEYNVLPHLMDPFRVLGINLKTYNSLCGSDGIKVHFSGWQADKFHERRSDITFLTYSCLDVIGSKMCFHSLITKEKAPMNHYHGQLDRLLGEYLKVDSLIQKFMDLIHSSEKRYYAKSGKITVAVVPRNRLEEALEMDDSVSLSNELAESISESRLSSPSNIYLNKGVLCGSQVSDFRILSSNVEGRRYMSDHDVKDLEDFGTLDENVINSKVSSLSMRVNANSFNLMVRVGNFEVFESVEECLELIENKGFCIETRGSAWDFSIQLTKNKTTVYYLHSIKLESRRDVLQHVFAGYYNNGLSCLTGCLSKSIVACMKISEFTYDSKVSAFNAKIAEISQRFGELIPSELWKQAVDIDDGISEIINMVINEHGIWVVFQSADKVYSELAHVTAPEECLSKSFQDSMLAIASEEKMRYKAIEQKRNELVIAEEAERARSNKWIEDVLHVTDPTCRFNLTKECSKLDNKRRFHLSRLGIKVSMKYEDLIDKFGHEVLLNLVKEYG
jgi:hypothetical protein